MQLTASDIDPREEAIQEYITLFPTYEEYAETLEAILDSTVAVLSLKPQPEVSTRPKSIASFSEKMYRPGRDAGANPISHITDLCGGRVMTFTKEDHDAVCQFLESNFEVNYEKAFGDNRMMTKEFGYRSSHFIVRLRGAGTGEPPFYFKGSAYSSQSTYSSGVFQPGEVKVEIPSAIWNLKYPWVEIQVRTMLAHVWSELDHNAVYKSPHPIPARWQRVSAGISSNLEQADESFSRILQGVREFENTQGSGLDEPSRLSFGVQLKALNSVFKNGRRELARLERDIEKRKADVEREYDERRKRQLEKELEKLQRKRRRMVKDNSALALKAAKLANDLEQWDDAEAFLLWNGTISDLSALRELGLAYCGRKNFVLGRLFLYPVVQKPSCDVPTILTFADACRPENLNRGDSTLLNVEVNNPAFNRDEVVKWHSAAVQKAFDMDADDPTVLYVYTERLLSRYKHFPRPPPLKSIVYPLHPTLKLALRRAEEQAEVGLNVPWVHARAGLFSGLLGEYHGNAVEHYAMVAKSKDNDVIQLSLNMIELLGAFPDTSNDSFDSKAPEIGFGEERRKLINAILCLGRIVPRSPPNSKKILFLFGNPDDEVVSKIPSLIKVAGITAFYTTDAIFDKLNVKRSERKSSGESWVDFTRILGSIITEGTQVDNIHVVSLPTSSYGATTGCRIGLGAGARASFWNGSNLNLNTNLVKNYRKHTAKKHGLQSKRDMIDREIEKLGEPQFEVLAREKELLDYLKSGA